LTPKAIGLSFLFGVLAIAIVTAGIALGIVIAFLTPFFIVFTGLWILWFITRDYPAPDSGSGTK